MALPTDAVSTVFVEATFTDPLGVVTEVDSQSVSNITCNPLIFRTKLAAGDITIAIPANARGVIITCGVLCDSNKTLKGIAGDTGTLIFTVISNAPYNYGSMLLLFAASPGASFVLTVAGGTSPDPDYTEFCFF